MNYVDDIKEKYGNELYIDKLKDYFKGEDIYVIGSGKSCDYVDPSFFDNKIVIGVNLVYCRYNTLFLIRKENKILKQVENIPNFKNSIHIISEGDCGGINKTNLEYYEKNRSENVFLFKHKPNKLMGISPPDIDNNELVVSFSTITSAMHLAGFLGAKNIILLGHDGGTLDGENNFESYINFINKYCEKSSIDKKEYKSWYENWLKEIQDQSIWTKKMLKEKYGANVHSLNPFLNFNLEGHIFK